MSTNIIEAVQKQMGYKPLHKVSPNTQQPEKENDPEMATTFEQASLISVVLGIYKKSKEVDDNVTWGIPSTNMLAEIFGNEKDDVIAAVAKYANVGTQKAENEMYRAGTATMQIIDSVAHGNAALAKSYLTDQRTNILLYLPPALHMGDLLHDNTIDDRTNKMQGPMSGLAHIIEKVFSSSK
ncbi:unnamed protein product [Rotaria sordida]|uniref:Uncharacterized protein n=1 Tax=Rotaria sordida TaxID=392033 RepID=A0A813PD05_9BILA|nr:unnamed protein product [Rotaria sordida]